MIDISTYHRIHKSDNMRPPPLAFAGMQRTKNYDSWPMEVKVTESPDDSIFMMLPPCILGFEMQAKKWGMYRFRVSISVLRATLLIASKVRLNVEQIEPVVWNKIAFERLVLEQKSKELIQALVTVHMSAQKMGDIISGKGNGLIILLHGSPGVGKTLTAGNVKSKSDILLQI
jgi:hypothetical protein